MQLEQNEKIVIEQGWLEQKRLTPMCPGDFPEENPLSILERGGNLRFNMFMQSYHDNGMLSS